MATPVVKFNLNNHLWIETSIVGYSVYEKSLTKGHRCVHLRFSMRQITLRIPKKEILMGQLTNARSEHVLENSVFNTYLS